MIRDSNEPPKPSRVINRILGSRHKGMPGDSVSEPKGSSDYVAYEVTEGFPQMAFTLGVYRRGNAGVSVESHGIQFHDVKKPKWRSYEGFEFITFSHCGEAYTLRGLGLYELYIGILNCTAKSALEFEPSVFGPPEEGAPIIDRVAVTDVAEMVRKSREDREGRGRPPH